MKKRQKNAVNIPPEASELANNLFTTIIPKKGVGHVVLSLDKIPRKGLPEIERPSNTDQSDVKISTTEYIEMVGPVLKYQPPTRRSNFVKGILDIKNTSVRDEATRAASKYLDSFEPEDQAKLIKHAPKMMKNNPVSAVSEPQADAGRATTNMA